MKIAQLFTCHNYTEEKKLKVAAMEFTELCSHLVEPIAKRGQDMEIH